MLVVQVKSLLNRSRLIGRRFPIVQVMVDGDMVEVSSFSTGVALTDLPFDAAALLGRKVSPSGLCVLPGHRIISLRMLPTDSSDEQNFLHEQKCDLWHREDQTPPSLAILPSGFHTWVGTVSPYVRTKA